MQKIVMLGAAVAAIAAGLAVAQTPPPAAPAPPPVPGYLTAAVAPDVSRILSPPPAEGGPRQKQDLDTFLGTRALQGSPRWTLATADVSYAVPYLLEAFSCSAGVTLTPDNAPKTALLLRRVLRDSGLTSSSAKDVFKRKRPYLLVDGPICVAKTDALAATPDYPSGHATLSWASGLVLSELMPQRATEIMARARAYGESRVVCGVHTPSAIEAGRSTGAATVAAEHGLPEFRADLESARAELAALTNSAVKPDAGRCQAEAALIGPSPF